MVITPNSKVKLIKNPLKLDSNNEMMFANATAQYNYFTSLPKLEFDNLTYVRKDDVLRIPTDETGVGVTYEKLLQYNFCMYQNTAFGSKWFYAFIDDIKWINPSLTELHLKTAYYQTWQFDLVFKDSFIEREHVNDDAIGHHTLPENVETGDPVIAKTFENLNVMSGTYICVALTQLPSSNIFTSVNFDRNYNGIFSGLIYFIFDSASDCSKFLEAMDLDGKGEAVNSIFLVPIEMCPNPDWHTITYDEDITFKASYIPSSSVATILLSKDDFVIPTKLGNNYVPKNNKLFTYPYSYMILTNNVGSDTIFRYEDFANRQPSFAVIGSLTPGCSIKCIPRNYKNSDDYGNSFRAFNFGVVAGKLPVCSWASDVYTNWLTQNGVNIALQGGQSILQAATGLITGNLGTAASGLMGVAGLMAEKYKHSLIPDQVKGNTNSGDVVFSANRLKFSIYYMSCRDENAKCIDDYFTMFGYQVNRVGTPHLHVRTYYDYIKTIDVNIEGDVPETDLEEIRKMFNNGIRFWHNTSYYLNFSVNNTIIS